MEVSLINEKLCVMDGMCNVVVIRLPGGVSVFRLHAALASTVPLLT